MKAKAVISCSIKDLPKIKVTSTGAEVTFELYDISLDELRQYADTPLNLEITEDAS